MLQFLFYNYTSLWTGITVTLWFVHPRPSCMVFVMSPKTYDNDELLLRFLSRIATLLWRHNDHDSVSNHQPRGCLLSRLFRRRSKKTSKLRVTGLCVGNSPGPVNSPHKGPVTRKMFPFDDVIMNLDHLFANVRTIGISNICSSFEGLTTRRFCKHLLVQCFQLSWV